MAVATEQISVLTERAVQAGIADMNELENFFSYCENIAEKYNITEKDVNEEIKKYRNGKRFK
ncbi:MAG: hypothetical protein LBQ87_02265 [Candidatus Fibromonas sp.]|jgi:hypothetical protein|nr:hypothetical protein [Candidatus Fibromonas sp.]